MWVIFTAVASVIAMLLGVIDHLDSLLTFQSVFLFAWTAILVSYALVVRKLLKISLGYFEHRQVYLYVWNPIGVNSLIIASIIGTFASFGYMGFFLQSVAAFFAALLAFVLTIIIALVTKGKYYSKKEVEDVPKEEKFV